MSNGTMIRYLFFEHHIFKAFGPETKRYTTYPRAIRLHIGGELQDAKYCRGFKPAALIRFQEENGLQSHSGCVEAFEGRGPAWSVKLRSKQRNARQRLRRTGVF